MEDAGELFGLKKSIRHSNMKELGISLSASGC
jgi:hypothetical protein